LKTTHETKTGRNTKFKDTNNGKTFTRPQLVKEIKKGNYKDYHIRKINNLDTPVSNPDKSSNNNLG